MFNVNRCVYVALKYFESYFKFSIFGFLSAEFPHWSTELIICESEKITWSHLWYLQKKAISYVKRY